MRSGMVAMVSLLVVGACATQVLGGTLDRPMISVTAGIAELGGDLKDASDYLDNIYVYGVSGALPLGRYVSLLAGVSRSTTGADFSEEGGSFKVDLATLDISGGVRVQLLSENPITPFGAALYSHAITDVDISVNSEDGADDGEISITRGSILLVAGAELSINDRLSIQASYTHIMEQDTEVEVDGQKIDVAQQTDGSEEAESDDTGVVTVMANFWLNDNIAIGALGAYEMENETMTYQGSLGISF